MLSYKQFKGEQHKGKNTDPLLYTPIFIFTPLQFTPLSFTKGGTNNMKRYYNLIRKRSDTIQSDIWHCTADTALSIAKAYDYIIPLDRKPRNTEIREG